jgi:glycosyltransferase involved in cell wall biosynthesis
VEFAQVECYAKPRHEASSSRRADPSVTAPTTTDDSVARLLAALDRRLRARRLVGREGDAVAADAERLLLDADTLRDGTHVRSFSGPYFNPEGGGPLESAMKRLLNLPIRLFGRPQSYVNQAVADALEASAQSLRASLDLQGMLLDQLGAQAERVEGLHDRLRRLSGEPVEAAPPPARRTSADGPLRVGLVSRTYPPRPDVGGIARYTQLLAHALHALGHEVHVFTDGVAGERRDDTRLVVHGVAPDLLPIAADAPMTDRILRWTAAVSERVRHLGGLDVVESCNWESEGLGVLRAGTAPLIVRMATPLVVEARENGRPPSDDLDGAVGLERWLIGHADGVVYSTDAILSTIEHEMGVRVPAARRAHIPFGVAPPASATAAAGGPPSVLFVGRLEARKGIDTLLTIVPALLERHPSLVVDVVGKDNAVGDASARRRFEAAHGRPARCRFHGAVDDDRLERFYRDCTVFVAPSRYESFGLVYLEAMRWGKPVVGCRTGGVPEVVRDGETGLLVPPGDPAALEAALARLLDDAELRARLGTAARAAVEGEFSAARMAERTVAFYRVVLARHALA